MQTSVRTLAALVGVASDSDFAISSAAPITEAGVGHITFIDHEKYLADLRNGEASAVVVPIRLAGQTGKIEIVHHDPLGAFVQIAIALHGLPDLPVHDIDPFSRVDASATVGDDASIHAFVSVGAQTVIGARCRLHSGASIGRFCTLGDDVTIHPNAVIYDGCTLGHRVTVHANTVVGADGFGYRFQAGKHVKIPQLSHVEIGDDVEIGACTTVDCGTFKPTRVGAGTKIDNHVMIAHNCQVGRHNILVSQVGMAGSSSTGDYVVMAGQAGVIDHVHIGDRAVIGGRAGVISDVPADARMLGTPATPERDQKRMMVSMMKLPEIRQEVRRLVEQLRKAG